MWGAYARSRCQACTTESQSPKDTWVAWAANKRGYKALPHFEVGMFASHLFVIFAIIYESPNKATFAQALEANLSDVRSNLPDHFYWSMDHMAPEGTEQQHMDNEDFQTIIHKLQQVKKRRSCVESVLTEKIHSPATGLHYYRLCVLPLSIYCRCTECLSRKSSPRRFSRCCSGLHSLPAWITRQSQVAAKHEQHHDPTDDKWCCVSGTVP